MGGDIPREVLEEAAEAVRERIREDAERLQAPMREIVAFIGDHLLSPELTVKNALAAARTRSNSARDRFRFATGLAPTAYVLECRMEVALRLLQLLPDVSIHRIAHALGFQENTFHKSFRRFCWTTAHRTRLRMEAHPELREMPPALLRRETLEMALLGQLGEGERAAFQRTVEALGTKPWEICEEASADEDRESLDGRLFDEVMRERLATASPREQSELIRNGFPFESALLPHVYMRWSREGCRDDRDLGVRIAELAVGSVWALRCELGPTTFRHLLAEAQANLGNARRLVFDFAGAERAFAEAEAELAKYPAPAELQAEIFLLKASLRQYQRRFSEARGLLDRSLAKASAPISRARALLTRGVCHEIEGNDAEAETDCRTALQELEEGAGFYVRISAHISLTILYTRQGEHGKAQAELARARQQAPEVGSRRPGCYLSWIEGVMSHTREQRELAEQQLSEARNGFAAIGDPVSAAAVGLDLALLWCEQGRRDEVEVLMAEALPLFKKLRFDAEGYEALRLLRRAAGRRKITAALLGRLRNHLERADMVPRRP